MARRTAQDGEASEEAPRRVITSFTFDTGMLIALERRKAHAEKALRDLARRRHIPVVPAVVFAEWWRGRTDHREELLSMVRIEPMTPRLCRATEPSLIFRENDVS